MPKQYSSGQIALRTLCQSLRHTDQRGWAAYHLEVYNTGEQPCALRQGTGGRRTVTNANYDFSSVGLQLPSGLMLGWATREGALRQYVAFTDSFQGQ